MDERASGLILRTRPLTETSLIVHWLTPDHGRLATVAKGARRPKSPFRGKIDLFHELEFSFVRSRRSELHTLREANLLSSHVQIRQNWSALQQASYGAALIEQATETDTPLPEIFALFRGLLGFIAGHPPRGMAILAFELALLRELGLQPNSGEARLTAASRDWIERLESTAWSDLAVAPLTTAQEAEVARFLHGFLLYHLGRLPAGRHAALSPPPAPGNAQQADVDPSAGNSDATA